MLAHVCDDGGPCAACYHDGVDRSKRRKSVTNEHQVVFGNFEEGPPEAFPRPIVET